MPASAARRSFLRERIGSPRGDVVGALGLKLRAEAAFDSDAGEQHVELRLHDDDRTLVVRIVADGKELEPFGEIADPDLDAFLQDQAMGGLGFHLMRKYTDDISCRRQDGFNHLTLTKTVASE